MLWEFYWILYITFGLVLWVTLFERVGKLNLSLWNDEVLNMFSKKKVHSARNGFRPYFLCALVALLLAGAVFRVAAFGLRQVSDAPVGLPVPLSQLPFEISGWTGQEVPISETVQRVAGNDDFVSRLYTHSVSNEWATVYVAYSARPRTMVGHRPQVCYTGSGWIHDGTDKQMVDSISGRQIPCLIHRFHKPEPQKTGIVVLNFYLVNGRLTHDESVFSGIGMRTPNIAGNAARYVAQVQISSSLEISVRSAAKDFTDLMLDYFPDENGVVRASEY